MKLNKVYTIGSFKALEHEGPGMFEAVVSVFGNVDLQGDRTMRGAFKNTINAKRRKGDPIPVIWSHDWLNPDAHIGFVDPNNATETSEGLLVKGQMDVHKPFASQVFDLLKERRVKEWSFAYDTVKEKKAEDGANELVELDLIECGPCLKGANPETYTVSAKSALERELNEAYEQTKRWNQFIEHIRTVEDPELATALSKAFFFGETPRPPAARYHVERVGSKFAVIANATDTAVTMHEDEEAAEVHVRRLEAGDIESGRDDDVRKALGQDLLVDEKAHVGHTIIDESLLEGPVVDEADAKVEGKPWHIEERGDEFCVIKDDTGDEVACHATREDAEAQVRALYAGETTAEPEAEKTDTPDLEKTVTSTDTVPVVTSTTNTTPEATTFTITIPDGEKAGRVIGARAASQLKESLTSAVDEFVKAVNGAATATDTTEETKVEEPDTKTDEPDTKTEEPDEKQESPTEFLTRLLGEEN